MVLAGRTIAAGGVAASAPRRRRSMTATAPANSMSATMWPTLPPGRPRPTPGSRLRTATARAPRRGAAPRRAPASSSHLYGLAVDGDALGAHLVGVDLGGV